MVTLILEKFAYLNFVRKVNFKLKCEIKKATTSISQKFFFIVIFEEDQLKNGYFTRLNEFENHQRFQFRKFNVGARQKFFQTFVLITFGNSELCCIFHFFMSESSI